MTHRCLAAALLLALAPIAQADEEPALVKTYNYRVSVDAEGKVTGFERSSAIPDALTPTLDGLVEAAEFEPARVGAQAVSSRTSVYVTVQYEGEDDALRALPVKLTSGGNLKPMAPPRYPPNALRDRVGAEVWATLSFRPDGSLDPDASSIDSVDLVGGKGRAGMRQSPSYRAQFETATREAMGNWTLVPDEVDGKPIAMTVRVPTRYCFSTRRNPGCTDLWPVRPDPLPSPQDAQVQLAAIKPAAPITEEG